MDEKFVPAVDNFTRRLLDTHFDWYNYFEPVPKHILETRSREVRRKHKGGTTTLHAYQTFNEDVVCLLNIKTLDENKFQLIRSTEDALVKFSIGGGAEIPHFCLSLRLQLSGEPRRYHTMLAIWTAWGHRDYHHKRPAVPLSSTPSSQDRFTFSHRLTGVNVFTDALNENEAIWAMGREGADCIKFEWSHYAPPIAFGTDIPKFELSGVSAHQQRSVELFTKMFASEATIRCVTRTRANLMDDWRFMASMPVPTLPPYPGYNCAYEVHTGNFSVIKHIPSTDDEEIKLHYRIRETGWMNQPPKFAAPPKVGVAHVNPPLTFINEREYEVIKTVGLLREAEYQVEQYSSIFNHIYTFDLWPMSAVHGITGREKDAYFYAVLDGTPIRPAAEELVEQDLSLPEPGTPVLINIIRQKKTIRQISQGTPAGGSTERWTGVVVAHPKIPADVRLPTHAIFLRVKRPSGFESFGTVLEVTGKVTFGRQNPAIRQARSAIRYAMYGNRDLHVSHESRAKAVLLGRKNSTFIFHPNRRSVHYAVEHALYQLMISNVLNEQQLDAMRAVFSIGPSYLDFVTLITGPPGTGKTTLDAHIAARCRQDGKRVLIVCGSNSGLDVVADQVRQLFVSEGIGTQGVYRLDTEFGEESDMQLAPGDPGFRITPGDRFNTVSKELWNMGVPKELASRFTAAFDDMIRPGNRLSLGAYISQRLQKALSEGSKWIDETPTQREEIFLLWKFITYQECLAREGRLFTESLDNLDDIAHVILPGLSEETSSADTQARLHDTFVKGKRDAWAELQDFYIRHAHVVLCTAATAGRRALKNFGASFVIVEEASQITETDCLNGFIRFDQRLQKVILTGDVAQLPPTVLSVGRNEFSTSTKLSLFERLIRSGIPTINLHVQHRMHPEIASFVSQEFYEGKLTNHPSTSKGMTAQRFSNVMQKMYQCTPGASFFVSVDKATVWARKGGSSLFSPEYVTAISRLVQELVAAGCYERNILVLSYYNEERKILTEMIRNVLGLKETKVQSVDSSQGSESNIVILSTTRPGGQYGLGFVSDRNRMCVAMSRARFGFVVVGYEGMAAGHGGQGHQAWARCIEHYRKQNRLIRTTGNRQWLERTLHIPDKQTHTPLRRV